MSRLQLFILILTMPVWLGVLMVLWQRNSLFILVPCGIIFAGLGILSGILIYAAEIRTRADWDLVIRSVLHRLGFQVKPPKSLMGEVDLHVHQMDHDHSHKNEIQEDES